MYLLKAYITRRGLSRPASSADEAAHTQRLLVAGFGENQWQHKVRTAGDCWSRRRSPQCAWIRSPRTRSRSCSFPDRPRTATTPDSSRLTSGHSPQAALCRRSALLYPGSISTLSAGFGESFTFTGRSLSHHSTLEDSSELCTPGAGLCDSEGKVTGQSVERDRVDGHGSMVNQVSGISLLGPLFPWSFGPCFSDS